MLGVDSELGTSALRLWAAAGSAAALMTFAVFSLLWRPSALPASRTLQVVLVLVPAALGAAMVWAFLGRGDLGNRSAERRAFELRAEELSARALAPGSPLACLDGVVGENVEAACEKALFAAPANVASASSYVAARLSLLSSMSTYVRRGGADVDDVMAPLRRSLEADRFGFLAHVLANSRRLHEPKLQAIGRSSRCQSRAQQFECADTRPLSRTLPPGLGGTARWYVCRRRAIVVSQRSIERAQNGERRFSQRGVDTGGEHHKSRTDSAGFARRGGSSQCKSAGCAASFAKASERRCPSQPGRDDNRANMARARAAGARHAAGAGHTACCRVCERRADAAKSAFLRRGTHAVS